MNDEMLMKFLDDETNSNRVLAAMSEARRKAATEGIGENYIGVRIYEDGEIEVCESTKPSRPDVSYALFITYGYGFENPVSPEEYDANNEENELTVKADMLSVVEGLFSWVDME